jgi:hypothetical protein
MFKIKTNEFIKSPSIYTCLKLSFISLLQIRAKFPCSRGGYTEVLVKIKRISGAVNSFIMICYKFSQLNKIDIIYLFFVCMIAWHLIDYHKKNCVYD